MIKIDRPALIPYFTAGWPDEERFLAAVTGAARAGCTVFEVGFPFSDPVADGPVIQSASMEALDRGVDLSTCFALTKKAVDKTGLCAVVMTYVNIVYAAGIQEFCQRAAAAGAGGIILADLPVEEGEEYEQAAIEAGLDLVYLCAPTSGEERMRLLASKTRGFLYLVSVRGVTGARQSLPSELQTLISKVKGLSEIPVCVGFGISSPSQAAQVVREADGVIVGSAVLERIRAAEPEETEQVVYEFLASLWEAMNTSIAGSIKKR